MGFNDDVRNLFLKQKAAMNAAGLPTDKMLASLEDLQRRVGELNAKQEDLKKQLRETTEQYNALSRTMYATASGSLDMAIAAVDKRSDAAKNFRRLRSRITRPDADETPAVEPLPQATK